MINAVGTTETSAKDSGVFESMGSEAFLTLLIAQLKYQDPLEPTGAAEMMAQTSQFANVEAMQKLTDIQGQAMGFQQFSVATSMLGSEVTATSGEETITGVVTGVRASDRGPLLQLDSGIEIEMKLVTQVAAMRPSTGAPDA